MEENPYKSPLERGMPERPRVPHLTLRQALWAIVGVIVVLLVLLAFVAERTYGAHRMHPQAQGSH